MGYGGSGYGAPISTVPDWSYFDLAWLPDGVQSSGGVVTGWTDASGHGNHGIPSGSPAVAVASYGQGVNFDGSNDRIDCTFADAKADMPCSIWVLHEPDSVTPGGYSGILELTISGSSDQSLWLNTAYGSIVLRSQTDAFGYEEASPGLVVSRIEATLYSRSLYKNGFSMGSSGKQTPSLGEATGVRLGNRFANDVTTYDGKIYAVLIKFGAVPDGIVQRIDDYLATLAGLPLAFRYSDVPAATVTTGDPGFLIDGPLPTAGPVTFDALAVGYRNGRPPNLRMSTDLVRQWTPPGRGRVLPATGTFTVRDGAYSATAAVSSTPLVFSDPLVILAFGDSQCHKMQSGLLEYLYTIGDGNITFVGGVTAPAGFNAPAEGHDSWVLSQEAAIVGQGAQGMFDGPGSPFWTGGVLDAETYLASLADIPTDIIVCCAQNAPYLATLGSELTATLDYEKAAFVRLVTAINAEIPGIKIHVFNGFPMSANPMRGFGSYSQVELYRHKMYLAALKIGEYPAACPDIDVRVINTFSLAGSGTGPRDEWMDAVHLGPAGHERLVGAVLGSLLT